MSKYFDDVILKIGNQEFLIDDYIYINKLSEYELYAVCLHNKPLFIISPYFATMLLTNDCCHVDGLIRTPYLIEFLNKRKVVFKNCYYDLAYKNKNEIKEEYIKDIIENRDLFRFRG